MTLSAPTILVTGFDPFGEESINPSWEAVKLLPGSIGAARVVKAALPTEFHASWTRLSAAMNEFRPTAVICTGQADGRARISLERVAINLMDARIPDNAGYQPRDEAIDVAGPAAYFSSLPLRKIEAALTSAGIPAHISYSAGAYVCNYVFYRLRHEVPGIPGGFVHVPYCTDQVLERAGHPPFMSLEMISEGLERIIQSVVHHLQESDNSDKGDNL
jgi:pyroglutamyl-peptidase